MRISDWSSDVCSSDLLFRPSRSQPGISAHDRGQEIAEPDLDPARRAGRARRLYGVAEGRDRAQRIDEGAGADRAGEGRHPLSGDGVRRQGEHRSEEHKSELQSLMRISYAVLCLKKKK